jgi:hypothetical protein
METVVKELSIDDLCEEIFSKSPKPPHSSMMQLHENCAVGVPPEETGQYIFEMFEHILFQGISIVFPQYTNVNEDTGKKTLQLSKLSLNDFELLRKYMKSVGYDICLNIKPIPSELSNVDPKTALKIVFDEGEEECSCGWDKSKNINHFSNYYLHFIRLDNIGVSLHFLILKK